MESEFDKVVNNFLIDEIISSFTSFSISITREEVVDAVKNVFEYDSKTRLYEFSPSSCFIEFELKKAVRKLLMEDFQKNVETKVVLVTGDTPYHPLKIVRGKEWDFSFLVSLKEMPPKDSSKLKRKVIDMLLFTIEETKKDIVN